MVTFVTSNKRGAEKIWLMALPSQFWALVAFGLQFYYQA